MPLEICKDPQSLRSRLGAVHREGKTIGFVPTMGALHDGHIMLARTALSQSDHGVVSIFVNPKQFAPHEDFDRYPRTLEADCAKLEEAGVHTVYAPAVEDMYPQGFQTTVTVADVSKPLEGEFRPHFFAGVATVVARLLLQVGADKAFFGEKDYQQLQVVTRMVEDLAIPTQIIGVPTVREDSGLALSSRNAYLSPEQKQIAVQLSKTLFRMAEKIRDGEDFVAVEGWAMLSLMKAGFEKIDYCTIRDKRSLQTPSAAAVPEDMRILAAAWLGKTRLIDNIQV